VGKANVETKGPAAAHETSNATGPKYALSITPSAIPPSIPVRRY